MTSEPDPVRAYVRANLGHHTREAVIRELVASGYERGHVEAVWREEWHAVSTAGAREGLTVLAVFLLVAGAIIGGAGALLIAAFLNGPMVSGGASAVPFFLLAYAAVYLGGGYALIRLVRWGVIQFGITGWLAVLIGVLLVPAYGILMFGGCLATFTLTT